MEGQYKAYAERLGTLMTYYSGEREDENLTGNIQNKLVYLRSAAGQQALLRDEGTYHRRRRHPTRGGEGWLRASTDDDALKVVSAWYHVTYHPDSRDEKQFWSFLWIVCDTLIASKAASRCQKRVEDGTTMTVKLACVASGK
jgi:RNA-dependent RNA polymerase